MRTRRWRETKHGSPAISSWGVHPQNEHHIAANNAVINGDFRCPSKHAEWLQNITQIGTPKEYTT
jgi:hypothetical protein